MSPAVGDLTACGLVALGRTICGHVKVEAAVAAISTFSLGTCRVNFLFGLAFLVRDFSIAGLTITHIVADEAVSGAFIVWGVD